MRDAQGHELSGATTEAADYFDRAVGAFTLIYGDAGGSMTPPRELPPIASWPISARRGRSRRARQPDIGLSTDDSGAPMATGDTAGDQHNGWQGGCSNECN
jgi:hypothetical protein